MEPPKSLPSETSSADGSIENRSRFVLVDAFRGLAAMWVLLFHVWHNNIEPSLHDALPKIVSALFAHGYLGVLIFFPTSGFVIAHSIFGSRITPQYGGRFIIRRMLRLDPPYWLTVLLTAGLLWGSSHLLHRRGVDVPTGAVVVAHLFYLQDLLQLPRMNPVFWTLCYEVQFYLVFILAMALAQRLDGPSSSTRGGKWHAAVFGALLVLTLLSATEIITVWPGLFLHRWVYFFLGVMAYWAVRGFVRARLFWWLAGFTVVAVLAANPPEGLVEQVAVAGGTSILFCWTGKSGAIYRASLGPVAQYLGRISYSLYLTHTITASRIARALVDHWGGDLSLARSLVALALALFVALVTAQVFYLLIELPSLKLSHRFKRRWSAARCSDNRAFGLDGFVSD